VRPGGGPVRRRRRGDRRRRRGLPAPAPPLHPRPPVEHAQRRPGPAPRAAAADPGSPAGAGCPPRRLRVRAPLPGGDRVPVRRAAAPRGRWRWAARPLPPLARDRRRGARPASAGGRSRRHDRSVQRRQHRRGTRAHGGWALEAVPGAPQPPRRPPAAPRPQRPRPRRRRDRGAPDPHARPGRRERQRQVDLGALRDRPDRAQRGRRRTPRPAPRQARRSARRGRAAQTADGVPELGRRAQPLPDRRRDPATTPQAPRRPVEGGRAAAGTAAPRGGQPPRRLRHADARRALRRRAAAGRDRPGVRQRTRAGGVRRVRLGPRRLGAGGAAPARHAAPGGAPQRLPVHLPRPRGRQLPRGRRGRHLLGHDRRGGLDGGGAPPPLPPLHRGAAVGRPAARPGAATRPGPVAGRGSEPGRPAERLPLPHPLPRFLGDVCVTEAPPWRHDPATGKGVLCHIPLATLREVQRPLFDLAPADRTASSVAVPASVEPS
jgi:hypothetical protein